MEDVWRHAPCPALRIFESGETSRWELNDAARGWSVASGIADPVWERLVQGRASGAGGPPPGERLRVGDAAWARCCRIVLPDGELWWLVFDAGEPAALRSPPGIVSPALPAAQPALPAAVLALEWALDRADVSTWRIDLDTARVHGNAAWHRHTGFAPDPAGVPLEAVRQTVHPDDREAVLRAAREAMEGDRVIDIVARYQRTEGGWRTLLTRRVGHRDDSGRVRSLLGVSLDVSRLADERARALLLRERMEMMTDAVGLGLWSRDVAKGRLEWNDGMYRLYARDPADGPPTPDEWFERHVHPLDRERLRQGQDRAEADWVPNIESEFRTCWPDGQVRWIHAWSRRETRDGVRLTFGVHIDVTERRSAEQQLRRERERAEFATGAAGVAIWERAPDGAVTYWNAQMYRLRGLDPNDPRPLAELLRLSTHPDDLPVLEDVLQRHLRHGEPYDLEMRVVWPDGSQRWLATRGHLVRDGDGRPLHISGVNYDVTERRRVDSVLREKHRVEQAHRAQLEFNARMSHELRTPMNAVLGFTQLLANDPDEPPSERQQERLRQVDAAARHLMALIDDVLDLSRIESDAHPLSLEAVPLDGVVRESARWVEASAQRSGIELRLPAAPLPGSVRADRRRLVQVVTNLLTNAVKYNRAGGWVEVGTRRRLHGPARQWGLCVSDSGRGLTREQIAVVFQPFNRLGVERDGIEGTGIGLTIAQQLAQRMDGEIEVDSEPGVGSEFRVWLPQAPAPDGAPQGPVDTAAAPPGDAPMTVLCIEDNPVNMMLVTELIALRPAIRMVPAESGVDGIAAALRVRPDVVLLDLQLPDLHGTEVLRRLRREPSLAGTRIIALSANAVPEDIAAAREAGFDDYWTKPIDFARFLGALDALAARHAALAWKGDR